MSSTATTPASAGYPFYLGDDARRIVVHHKGEGCLTFTGGKIWGGGEHVLIRMDVDPAGLCFQP